MGQRSVIPQECAVFYFSFKKSPGVAKGSEILAFENSTGTDDKRQSELQTQKMEESSSQERLPNEDNLNWVLKNENKFSWQSIQ